MALRSILSAVNPMLWAGHHQHHYTKMVSWIQSLALVFKYLCVLGLGYLRDYLNPLGSTLLNLFSLPPQKNFPSRRWNPGSCSLQPKVFHCTHFFPWEMDERTNTWQAWVTMLSIPLKVTQITASVIYYFVHNNIDSWWKIDVISASVNPISLLYYLRISFT